jgi:hypothetical protein
MKYIKEFNEYEPEESSVRDLEKYLDVRYEIKDFRGDKLIVIDDKPYYLSGFQFNKGRLTDKIFYDITSEVMDLHEPSLRKAIKNWIDKHSMLKENLENFDLQFAMAKIGEHFDEDKVIEMFDLEILEWVDSDWQDDYESEYDWYVDHNNGEAQDSVINQIINWYKKEFNKTLNIDEHSELFDAIKSEYDCLNY